MNQELLELVQLIAKELENLERVIRDAETGWQRFSDSSDYFNLCVVALNLHSFYTGLEKLFQDIAKTLNERLSPDSSKWHEALLRQMATEVAGIRPAVISLSSRDALIEYRKFRHLVRNIYPFRLDSARIQPLVEAAPNVLAQVRSDLLTFAAFLESQGRKARE